MLADGEFHSREVIPRFRIPVKISSDKGVHFVNRTMEILAKCLKVKCRFGCACHPQSQGMVERANGSLRVNLAKICADSEGKLKWSDALPLALMCMRKQTNRTTH